MDIYLQSIILSFIDDKKTLNKLIYTFDPNLVLIFNF